MQQGQGPNPNKKGPKAPNQNPTQGPPAYNNQQQQQHQQQQKQKQPGNQNPNQGGKQAATPLPGIMGQMSLGKSEDLILMVAGLPGKLDFQILKAHLQEHANQVSGRVKYVKNGQAFITFGKKADAERAIHLFHGREIYGKKLNVTVVSKIPFDNPQNKKPNNEGEIQSLISPLWFSTEITYLGKCVL
jgi:hypothetical protein